MLKTCLSILLTAISAVLFAQSMPVPCNIQATMGISICIDPPGCVIFSPDMENGTAPYSYLWGNGTTNQSLNFPGSTYQQSCEAVTVTDNRGCVAITGDIFSFTSNSPSTFSIQTDTFETNGTLLNFDVSLNDQHGPGTFQLVQPAIHGTVDFQADGTGTYSPDATWCGPDYFRYLFQDDSCRYSEIITVTILNGTCAQILTGNIDCNSTCTGEAWFYQHNLLTPPLTYQWSNGETGEYATSLCAGPVSVTVVDALGNTEVYQSNIAAGTLSVSIPGVSTSCANVNVLLEPVVDTAGTGILYFLWSGDGVYQKTNRNQTVYPGQPNDPNYFNLLVTSESGCVDSASFHVEEIFPVPYLPNQAFTLLEPLTCPVETLHISPAYYQGGTPPYQFQWTSPLGIQASTPELYWPNITSAHDGTFRLKITDINGCYDYASSYFNFPDSLTQKVVVYGPTNTLCLGSDAELWYGMTNSWIEMHTTEWTGPDGFYSTERNPVLHNLTQAMAGTYYLKVSFGDDCFATSSITINVASSSLQVNDLQYIAPTDCVAPYDGKVTVSMSEPPPYLVSMTWGGSQNFTTNPFTVNNARPGDYYSMSISKNNCTAIAYLDVPYPTPPSVVVTDETCNGGGTGTVLSPNQMQTVSWYLPGINSWLGQSITDLPAGTYYVNMNDNVTKCDFQDTVTIAPYLDFEMSIIDTPACENPTGVLLATALGQTEPPLNFTWSNGFSGAQIEALSYGWYSVTLTDGSGCQQHQNVFLPPDEACAGLIMGRVLLNTDCSCNLTGTELPYPNLRVCVQKGNEKDCAYTDETGTFYLSTTDTGQYVLSIYPDNDYLTPACPITSVNMPTITSDISDVNIFTCGPATSDYSITAYCGVARPGFSQKYRFKIANEGLYTKDTALVSVNLSDQLSIEQITPTPISYDPATNQVTWKVLNIPINSYEYFEIKATVLAPLNEVLETYGDVTIVRADGNITDNTTYCETIVTGSYDPNDKSVNIINANTSDSVLVYTIQFQNTGTDTAFTVILRDTLDGAVFDVNSVEPIMASHHYQLDVEGENILVFTFENIMLPDSNRTVEGSKGFATFSIHLKPGLTNGALIHNRAAIYFDYNVPVITNETQTQIIIDPDCQLPSPPIINNPDTIATICEGSSISLSAEACQGCEVTWSNGQTGQAISVNAQGSYFAIASNQCGQSLPSAPIEVSVTATPQAPVISVEGSTELCVGQEVVLLASSSCTDCPLTWSNGQMSPSISVSTQGSYFAIASNQCGQSLPSAPIEVSVTATPQAPVISAEGSTELCVGQEVVLLASSSCTDCQLTWSNGQMSPSISVSTQGSYFAIASNQCGQGLPSAPIEVSVSATPQAPVISAEGSTELCLGQEVVLLASNSCTDCQLIWSNGEIGNTITVNEAGTYTAFIIAPFLPLQCNQSSTSNEVVVETLASPVEPIIVNNGPSALCEGQTTVLGISNISDCEGCQVLWSTGQASSSIQVNLPGIYSASFSNTCGTVESNFPIEITNYDFVPSVTLVNACMLSAPIGTGYQWYLNDSILIGETGQSIQVVENGLYTVTMVDENGCNGISQPIAVDNCTTGTKEEQSSNYLSVYPNPASVDLYFELQLMESSMIQLHISSMDGKLNKLIFNGHKNSGIHSFVVDASSLPDGIYLYQLTGLTKPFQGKVLLVK